MCTRTKTLITTNTYILLASIIAARFITPFLHNIPTITPCLNIKYITHLIMPQECYFVSFIFLTWTTLILTIYVLHTLTKINLLTIQILSFIKINYNHHKQNNTNHLHTPNTYPPQMQVPHTRTYQTYKNTNPNTPKIYKTYNPYLSQTTYTLLVILIITLTHYNTSPPHNTQLTFLPQNSHKTYQYTLQPQHHNHKSSITST